MTVFRRSKLMGALFSLLMIASARGDESTERVVVSADRLPDAESSAPFSVTAVDSEELRRAPQLRLDDILRAVIEFRSSREGAEAVLAASSQARSRAS